LQDRSRKTRLPALFQLSPDDETAYSKGFYNSFHKSPCGAIHENLSAEKRGFRRANPVLPPSWAVCLAAKIIY